MKAYRETFQDDAQDKLWADWQVEGVKRGHPVRRNQAGLGTGHREGGWGEGVPGSGMAPCRVDR